MFFFLPFSGSSGSSRSGSRSRTKRRSPTRHRKRSVSESSSSESSSPDTESTSSEEEEDNPLVTRPPPPKVLSEKEMNELAAKVLKAEIMGNQVHILLHNILYWGSKWSHIYVALVTWSRIYISTAFQNIRKLQGANGLCIKFIALFICAVLYTYTVNESINEYWTYICKLYQSMVLIFSTNSCALWNTPFPVACIHCHYTHEPAPRKNKIDIKYWKKKGCQGDLIVTLS